MNKAGYDDDRNTECLPAALPGVLYEEDEEDETAALGTRTVDAGDFELCSW